jgi:soluble lytic murein transglycosylase-like protein
MAQDFFEQLHNAVKQAESRGQRYDEKGNLLTSPKGAQGEMQVMPKTSMDPGFGVAPAKGGTPDEIARVGRDYLKAMVDKYGDTQKALIAYNWGPGNTDKWLASGANPKVLPAETQKYVSDITGMLGGKKMRVSEASDVQDLVKDAGPGYKAAMAMMFLADDKPQTGEDDIWKEAEAPVEEETAQPSALAELDLGYQSPFPTQKPQQVAHLASGGIPFVPRAVMSGSARDELQAIKDQWDAYTPQATAYNDALNKWKTETYDPYVSALDKYNTAAQAWNKTDRTKAFDMVAPAEIKDFSMAAPKAPEITQEQYQAKADAANSALRGRQIGIDAVTDPERFGLSLNKFFAHGGIVHRADGSPEYGEIPTGGITEDTRTTMATPITARGALNALKEVGMDVGRGAVSNAESLVRGAVSQVPGVFGDLESLGRKAVNFSFGPGGVKVDEKTYAPTSEEIRAATPRMTAARPESSGMESLGEVMAPGMAKAAAPVAKVVGREAAGQMLRGMEGEGMLAPISPPIMYAREPGKAMPGSIYSHLPSNEAPFVGRLDEYVANLPGPVQKQQFFGQLKGKFRDYEIGRAEEALKDLPDNAKLTPSDLLNRVKEVYDPGLYKTTVLPADQSSVNGYFRSMDNPFYNKETDEGVHLGVIHLNQNIAPEVAQRQQAAHEAARAVKLMSNDWYLTRYPEKMDELQDYLKNSGVQLQPELAKKIDTGVSQYRKIASYEGEMKAAKDKLMYPNLDPQYDTIHEKYAAQFREADPTMPTYVSRTKTEPLVVKELADQANTWLAKNGYKGVELPEYGSFTNPSMHAMTDFKMGLAIQEAFHPVKEQVGMADRNLAKYMKGAEEEFKKAVGHELPYMGQHESLGGGPSPIAFSRFSEHTTEIPGIGKTDGIYVHELQSDMLDDLRKMGPKGGAKEKDAMEYEDTLEKLKSLEKSRVEAEAGGNANVLQEIDNQMAAAQGRAKTLSNRLRNTKADYTLPEAFSKMETSGNVAQQLMAKNAIAGAIQQGKNFVAFPGKESAQAQLYEKLPRTLKDVAKDLGPGFEIRPIELQGPQGKTMHTAVVWGPEAAARIQKKGVPFATGGSVDKSNIDHRKYL